MHTTSDISKLDEVYLSSASSGIPEFAQFLAGQGVKTNIFLCAHEREALERRGWNGEKIRIIDLGEPNAGQLAGYARDCGFLGNGTFFASYEALHEADYYSGNAYSNLVGMFSLVLGLPVQYVAFKGGEFVSDGVIGIVSRNQSDFAELERKLGIEIIGINLGKHIDYFFNFVGEDTVLYNASLARMVTNKADGAVIAEHTEPVADMLAAMGYAIIGINRDLTKAQRYYSSDYLLSHLLLLGNTLNLDKNRVVIIEDFRPDILTEIGFESLADKIEKHGIRVLQFPVKRHYEMFSSRGGPRCMTFPVRKRGE